MLIGDETQLIYEEISVFTPFDILTEIIPFIRFSSFQWVLVARVHVPLTTWVVFLHSPLQDVHLHKLHGTNYGHYKIYSFFISFGRLIQSI